MTITKNYDRLSVIEKVALLIHNADFAVESEQFLKAASHPGAATVNADQHGVFLQARSYEFSECGTLRLGVRGCVK